MGLCARGGHRIISCHLPAAGKPPGMSTTHREDHGAAQDEIRGKDTSPFF